MIKSLEIKNFKSFLNEKISHFSPHLNLILGLNGQGKTNLYGAIKFLFQCEEKSKISEEKKRGYLNVL